MSALPYTSDWFNPLQWASPVLDKELRVLSRRKRTYWLRSLYPLLLILVVFGAWLSMRFASRGGRTSLALSGMDDMARSVVSTMVWMQFMLCQVMAAVLVCNAMSDEIRRRSLTALMTTPMRPVQILFGKLMGPMVMVWTLLAVSLPFLALVRVWGGIPWDYLVSTWTVTVCVTICLATLSLFLALWIRRPHQLILLVLCLLVVGYVSGFLMVRLGSQYGGIPLLINPWAILTALSMGFSRAGAAVRAPWQIHCLLMLGLAGVLFAASLFCLRRRALADPTASRGGMSWRTLAQRLSGKRRAHGSGPIRPVTGSPLLWKELGSAPGAYLVRQIPWILILAGVVVACTVLPYMLAGRSGGPGPPSIGVYSLVTSGISLLVTLRTATMAAWCVAREKEAGSWTVLLCTPLPDIWILRHKALSVILRNAVGWVTLIVGSLVFFTYLVLEEGAFEYEMGLYVLISFVGTIVSLYMVTGTGLYFSIRMRNGALAVTSTLGVLIAFHVVFRFLAIPLIMALGVIQRIPYVFFILNPGMSVVFGVVMFKLAGKALRRYIV